MNRTDGVLVGERRIGAGDPVYVIAEAGVNHDGDVAVAHELIELAVRTGADAVKFQTFDPVALTAPSAQTTEYQRKAGASGTQLAMLQQLTLPAGAWRDLAQHCRDAGITFLSSPFDAASGRLVVELGAPAVKVGSGELTNTPLLAELAALGRPMILSTGMGTESEVATALDAVATAPGVVLLHCVSAYPTPPRDANLRAISTLTERFGVPVGWSDHTTSEVTAIAAVALGALVLEKHITTDTSRVGPDHAASLDEAAFARYVAAVRTTETALGDGIKRRMPSEAPNAPLVRRSLHAIVDIPAGARLDRANVEPLRPERGLPPSIPLDGLRAARAIRAGEPVTEADVRSGG